MIFIVLPRQFTNSSCFVFRTYDVAGSINAYNFERQFKTLPAVVRIYHRRDDGTSLKLT